MRKFTVSFTKDEADRIETARLANESVESTIRRLVVAQISDIPKAIWSINLENIFDEFDSTFKRLAE